MRIDAFPETSDTDIPGKFKLLLDIDPFKWGSREAALYSEADDETKRFVYEYHEKKKN